MTEEKTKNIKNALIIGAILLLLILLSIMIYQLININDYKNKVKEYNDRINEYRRLISDGEDSLELRTKREWIIQRARELGLTLPDDIVLDE